MKQLSEEESTAIPVKISLEIANMASIEIFHLDVGGIYLRSYRLRLISQVWGLKLESLRRNQQVF